MAPENLTSLDAEEMAEHVTWRTEMLRASGYDENEAGLLARRIDVSVYEAIRIVDEGAEHHVALAQLAN